MSASLFDVLQADGELLLSMPYTARRERLAELRLDTGRYGPAQYPGGAADVQAASLALGLESMVGKSLASAYYAGQRRGWIKERP